MNETTVKAATRLRPDMRTYLGLFPLALSLIAGGCTGVVVQDDPGPRGGYVIGDFDYAAGKGAIETIVTGNPFGGPKQAFDERVRALMKHQNRGVPAEFVAGQSDRTDPLYKVVVSFNLPRAFPNYNMCKDSKALPSEQHPDRLDIAIAFCYGDQVKSDTTGWVENVRDIDDPKFAKLVRSATLYMLTDYDYRQDRGDGPSKWLP